MSAPRWAWAGRTVGISLAVLIATLFVCPPADAARRHGYVAKWRGPAKLRPLAPIVPDVPGPWTMRDAQVEPIGWGDIDGWSKDDHAAAFAAFLASCQPIARVAHPAGENRPMYGALHAVCRRALREAAPREGAPRAL
ncbi:MAG: rane-bound lytic murein transglycosylase, partial [Alphaproteobacteria bacterium]|nr:rane-bound lytic murein transglycosylase [Alphaproteobacteria bacterium]